MASVRFLKLLINDMTLESKKSHALLRKAHYSVEEGS